MSRACRRRRRIAKRLSTSTSALAWGTRLTVDGGDWATTAEAYASRPCLRGEPTQAQMLAAPTLGTALDTRRTSARVSLSEAAPRSLLWRRGDVDGRLSQIRHAPLGQLEGRSTDSRRCHHTDLWWWPVVRSQPTAMGRSGVWPRSAGGRPWVAVRRDAARSLMALGVGAVVRWCGSGRSRVRRRCDDRWTGRGLAMG